MFFPFKCKRELLSQCKRPKRKSLFWLWSFLTIVGCCNQHAITQCNAESMISKDCDSSVAKLILRDWYKCLKHVLKLLVFFFQHRCLFEIKMSKWIAFKLIDLQSICRNLVKLLHRLRCFISTTAVIKNIKARHNTFLLLYNS